MSCCHKNIVLMQTEDATKQKISCLESQEACGIIARVYPSQPTALPPPPPTPKTKQIQAGSFPAPNTTLVGVSISGGVMRHGAGYRSVPWDPGEEESSAGSGGGVLDDRVEGERWYKVRYS